MSQLLKFRSKLASFQTFAIRSNPKRDGGLNAADGSWNLEWRDQGRYGSLSIMESPAMSSKDPRRAVDPERGRKMVQWTWDWWTPDLSVSFLSNIITWSKINVRDDVDTLKRKIGASYKKFLDLLRSRSLKEISAYGRPDENVEKWLKESKDNITWHKSLLSPSSFVPKTMKPLEVKGRDFKFTVKPDAWTLYTRYDSAHGGDDFYTGYQAPSPAAARKLYLLVAKNVARFQAMDSQEFVEFLEKNKIPYKSISSSWR